MPYYPRNRRLNLNPLLFYAPLTEHKKPTMAWDNQMGHSYAGTSQIDSTENALYIDTNNMNNRLTFASIIPLINPRNLFFSCLVKPTYNTFGYNDMFGFVSDADNIVAGTSCLFARHLTNSRNNIRSGNITNFPSDTVIYATEGQWTFITFNLYYTPNDDTFYFRIFKNGILQKTPNHPNGIFVLNNVDFTAFGDVGNIAARTNNRFSIGGKSSANNTNCYYKHFSVYHNLTDAQVLKLFQNGGVPC